MRMKLLLVVCFLVIGSLAKDERSQVDTQVILNQNDNRETFLLLCRIYNLAKNPPIKPVDTKEYQKIVEDIDALSAAASGHERINTKTETPNSAQTQLIGVTHEARKLLDEIKNVNPEGEVERAKNAFNQVIFGEHGKEGDLSHGALRGVEESRPKACGGSNLKAKGESAGKNLIVDFFCLCAKPNEAYDGIEKVCGVSVGKGDNAGWGRKLDSADTMWNEIKNGCKNVAPQSVASTQAGNSLLRDFQDKVTTGGNVKVKNKDTLRTPGMLGTAVSEKDGTDFNCNGKAGSSRFNGAGVCIFYGVDKLEENIEWLKKFKTGLEIIDKLNTETASWKSKLTTLLNRARELYEKVKADSQLEEENMDEPIAAQHPNSAENENAESTTRSQCHSLLAWALLLQ